METNQTEEGVTHVLAGEIRFEKVEDDVIQIIPAWGKSQIPSELPPHGTEIEK